MADDQHNEPSRTEPASQHQPEVEAGHEVLREIPEELPSHMSPGFSTEESLLPSEPGIEEHDEPAADFETGEAESGLEPAAIASFEALEGDEDAPILPVRAIDDDDEEDEERDDHDDHDEHDEEADDEGEEEPLDEAPQTDEGAEDAEDAAHAQDAGADAGSEDPAQPPAAAGERKSRRKRGGRGRKKETQQAPADTSKRNQVMIVNDSPGEECRIAILQNGRLEQIFTERVSTATNVGNIYKGRVVNVEAAIQAAFIDFGEGQNGFLHISDLHPQYFPGQERTETVGRKIPRRERPPIQDALKRGQEVIVQVLKEGLGTKGPTLTSYISIPGRLLVMMPHMDRVGVSRKVEDEDQRREMRRILDSLDLPEGCGFILRTAGFDRTKTELQRDALYLQRLWQAMERRMASTGAPCTLYTESDLLVRTIRDVVDDSVEAIVVDSESAYHRARTFLQVVAPLNAPRLHFYDRPAPIFFTFGVEQQIEQIHSHKVPLPSGGALVIDQTEAMVTIDVNSGKSRSARDSETNAFNTNKEAVDEIARQLRLRDLGGIIVNDLIDMRSSKHRREIEERLTTALRHDRAKTTTLDISDFGIIEMTRQRMRPGLHKTHFMDCPHCHGSGEVRVPDAVAADCLRKAALLFCYERVHRVEIVCSVRVASVLLSARRSTLSELEERTGKRVDVRISETFAIDRVDIYAYDDRGADIEIDRLPRLPAPKLSDLPQEVPPMDDDGDDLDDSPDEGGRRRRRRRRKPAPADATAMALAGNFDDLPTPTADEPSVSELIRRSDAERQARRAAELAARAQEAQAKAQAAADRAAAGEDLLSGDDTVAEGSEGSEHAEGSTSRRKRRRRRRGRGGENVQAASSAGDAAEPAAESESQNAEAGEAHTEHSAEEGATRGKRKRRRRRKRGGSAEDSTEGGALEAHTDEDSSGTDEASEPQAQSAGDGDDAPSADTGRRRRSRRGRRSEEDSGERTSVGVASDGATAERSHAESPTADAAPSSVESTARKTIRSVTGWMRRLKGPTPVNRDDR